MKHFSILFLFFGFISCKNDPTLLHIQVLNSNLLPLEGAQVIVSGDYYDTSYYQNEIILNDTNLTDANGNVTIDYSALQIPNQIGFVTALLLVSKDSLYKEVNAQIKQFQTNNKQIILQ